MATAAAELLQWPDILRGGGGGRASTASGDCRRWLIRRPAVPRSSRCPLLPSGYPLVLPLSRLSCYPSASVPLFPVVPLSPRYPPPSRCHLALYPCIDACLIRHYAVPEAAAANDQLAGQPCRVVSCRAVPCRAVPCRPDLIRLLRAAINN